MSKKESLKKNEETNEIIVKEEAGLPSVISFEEDMAMGFEHTTSKDFKIPIVRVLQALSPEVDEDNPKYIDGAKPGYIYNISTKTAYDGKSGIIVVPVLYFRKWVEFVPRDNGGGYVDEYPIDHPVAKTGERIGKSTNKRLPNGNDLVETGYFPCVHIMENGNLDQVVIIVSSSGWDFARDWLAIMRSRVMTGKNGKKFTPAFFSHKYQVCTETKKKKQDTWKSFKVGEISQIDPVKESDIYIYAKEFHRQMNIEFTNVKVGSYKDDDYDQGNGTSQTSEEEDF